MIEHYVKYFQRVLDIESLKHVEEDMLNGDDDGIFALCTVSCIFQRYFYNLEKLVRQLF